MSILSISLTSLRGYIDAFLPYARHGVVPRTTNVTRKLSNYGLYMSSRSRYDAVWLVCFQIPHFASVVASYILLSAISAISVRLPLPLRLTI